MKQTLLFILLVIASFGYAQQVRGFYVDGFSSILGNTAREDSLLRFAENNDFNYLTLYEMHIVNANTPLTDVGTAQTFADFVEKAKTQYGIAEIGVAVENFNALNNVIHVYNQQHPDENQKVDVYNLEFEFWVPGAVDTGSYYCDTYLQPNGFSCDSAGGFDYFIDMLHKIDSLANLDGAISEVYFGWFNFTQGMLSVQTGVDRVLLSVYIPSSSVSFGYPYSYLYSRMDALGWASTSIDVIPLFSAEPEFMHDWAVNSDSFFQPLFSDLEFFHGGEVNGHILYNNIIGMQWFAYSDMPKKNMDLSVEEKSPMEDNLVVYPNPSNGTIHLELPGKNVVSVAISDVRGMEVWRSDVPVETITAQLPQGVYFVRVLTENGELNRKIVVR